jgi:oligosaccharide 4-alpha-D-glucosyltransferase
LFLSTFGYSQKKYDTPDGVFSIYRYEPDITQYTFVPKNYLHGEQVSNAVIVKPSGPSVTPLSSLLIHNYFDSAGYKGFRFNLAEDEKIFGTGERSIPLNRRGYKLNLYNNPWYGYSTNADNLNYSIPFIISSAGYGIFFDNPSNGYLDIGKSKPDVLEYGTASGELTYYYIPGKNVEEILHKYHQLVGTQPIPARWVLGNLMSRFGYRNEEQLMSTVKKMKAENFPIDAVILDLFWFGDSIKGTLGNLEWTNKKAWPDPAGMIANLKSQGINTILITEPFVLNTTPNFSASKKFHAVDSAGNPYLLTDFYFGYGGLLDIFRKETQDWFWSKYKAQISKGVVGWWGDLGEPERHPKVIYHNLKDLGFKRLFNADEVHNVYGHYWDKMLFDKYAKEYPALRLFNLNRSGFAGSPRYSVFPWSGDVSRSWAGLNAQLPLMIGMSMSGIPYIHADAGGFAGGDGDPQLYTRWLQFACFTPVLRPHGTALGDLAPDVKDIPSEPALYSNPYKIIVRTFMNIRYALLPYNYTLAYEQSVNGSALVRPLFYNNNTDPELYKAGDEYMWGSSLLIAPVMEKDARKRAVYLPAGRWYDLFTNEIHEGKKWLTKTVTLNSIPVFVKEGSFIPMAYIPDTAFFKNTGDYNDRDIYVKYYPSAKISEYTMFTDDGHTNKTLENKRYTLLYFTGVSDATSATIKISSTGFESNELRKIRMTLPGKYSRIKINGVLQTMPMTIANLFGIEDKSRFVTIEFKGRPVLIELGL